jgi:hypothetical protein
MSRLVSFLLVAALSTFAVGSYGQSAPVKTKDGISFLTGGIGATEREQIAAQEKAFNLKLVFTLVEGNYLSDVAVVVKDAKGRALLDEQARGPIFLAKLAPGAYTIQATHNGVTRTQKVSVSERLRTAYLRWPSKPGADFPGPKAGS